MRRKDREMDRDFALMVVDKCIYATLATITPDGKPYAVALSIVRDGDWVYFHGAKEGEKIDCFKANPDACMVCVGDTYCPEDNFTIKYESAVIKGKVTEVTDDDEKLHSLKILCERHTPTNMSNFDGEIKASFAHTAVWKMSIDEITGKRNK